MSFPEELVTECEKQGCLLGRELWKPALTPELLNSIVVRTIRSNNIIKKHVLKISDIFFWSIIIWNIHISACPRGFILFINTQRMHHILYFTSYYWVNYDSLWFITFFYLSGNRIMLFFQNLRGLPAKYCSTCTLMTFIELNLLSRRECFQRRG